MKKKLIFAFTGLTFFALAMILSSCDINKYSWALINKTGKTIYWSEDPALLTCRESELQKYPCNYPYSSGYISESSVTIYARSTDGTCTITDKMLIADRTLYITFERFHDGYILYDEAWGRELLPTVQ